MAYSPYGIQIEGGGIQNLPTINKDWISYQDAAPAQWSGYGSDSGPYQTNAARDAGYGFDWTKNGGAQPDAMNGFYGNNSARNFEWSFDAKGNPTARIKSGDKTGTYVSYKQDASGNYVPDYSSAQASRWDTNESQRGWIPIAAVIAGGFGAGMGAEALGVAGMGGAGGASMTAAEGAALGSEAAGGLTGIGAGGATAADVGAAAGAGTLGAETGTAAGLTELGTGAVPELTSASTIAEAETPWWQTAYEYGKTANEYKGYYDKATKAYNMMNPQEQRFQHYNEGYDDLSSYPSGGGEYGPPSSAAPDYSMGPPGEYAGGGAPSGGAGWDRYARVGGSLADMAAAYYSAQQQKDLSGNQKRPFSEMQGKQDEYNKLLMASYYNPDTFYNSNQWKGLSSVYGNKLDRNAGNVGRLANDADRAVMMQKYGMGELENYRTGLRGNINAYDPSKLASMYGEGLKSEAGANTAPFAAASKGSTASQVQGYVSTAKSAYDIWQGISKWFT